MECWTCKSNSGEKRISPGPTIFEGKYWFVEHARGRFTHHLELWSTRDIDDEVRAWLQEAWAEAI